ncbi:MAG: histidinol-phosphate transaminase [Epulopiscium sp. Nuni2H_MBin003]|nr:MAG: histidinol-phosphate transaminase [Epulopiscium sp. Nuni2H_MBin003]
MSKFLVQNLSNLVAYVPGEQPKKNEFIKLNTNENPYPPPGVDILSDVAINLNLYNDPNCTKLTNVFGKYYNLAEDEVIFGNGSDEILAFCYMAFCEKEIAFPNISYGFYSVYSELFGLAGQKIPLTSDFRINKEDYFNLGKTIIIANPNAPTGIVLSLEDIEDILKHNQNNIVIIDEAYADFGEVTCKKLINQYDNIVVVGTFSKSRNLAGARLGYAIANRDLIEDIKLIKNSFNPYNVNALTQALGVVSIEQDEYFKECVDKIVTERKRFISFLDELDFHTLPSSANFVFTKHNTMSGAELAQKLREHKILVRYFDKIGEYVRITIGTTSQMDYVRQKFIKIIKADV